MPVEKYWYPCFLVELPVNKLQNNHIKCRKRFCSLILSLTRSTPARSFPAHIVELRVLCLLHYAH